MFTVLDTLVFTELNNEKGKKRMEFDKVKAMDMSFDVSKIFQERLASSMGLDKYQYIMEQVSTVNVAVDNDFQRIFNESSGCQVQIDLERVPNDKPKETVKES